MRIALDDFWRLHQRSGHECNGDLDEAPVAADAIACSGAAVSVG